jgi:hypothetical protein
MEFDEIKNAWDKQDDNKIQINANVLMAELNRSGDYFRSIIMQRDRLEIGAAVLCAAVFFAFGIYCGKVGLGFVWPIFLLTLLCVYLAAFLIGDHMLQRRKRPDVSGSIRGCIEAMLWDVNHQAWLLKNVFWWYLLPPGIGLTAWFVYAAQLTGAWVMCMLMLAGTVGSYWGVYRLNQKAVKKELVPRKEELERMLKSLGQQANE